MGTSMAAVSPLRVQAQDLPTPRCVGGAPGSATLIAQDACQQAYDVYQLIAPQLGLALAGGNATAGTGSVLGGLGHFSVGVRVNAFDGLFPNTSNDGYPVSTNGAQRRTLPTKGQWFGAPTADAAIGLYKGFPLALTNVLGVDALVSAEYVPTIHAGRLLARPVVEFPVRVWRANRFVVGVHRVPRRVVHLDRARLADDQRRRQRVGDVGVNGSSIDINNMDVKTRAWRVVASKSLIAFSVAAGVGRDSYEQSATLTGTVNQFGAIGEPVAGRDSNRWAARISSATSRSISPCSRSCFEAGDAVGGSVATFNSFVGRTRRPLAGLRIVRPSPEPVRSLGAR